jgi:hypothetical protein
MVQEGTSDLMQPNAVEGKLLERLATRLDHTRDSLAKELRVVAAVVLAFQFLIFLPYLDLSDRAYHTDRQIRLVQQDQSAINSVRSQVTAFTSQVEAGRAQLSQPVAQAPATLRSLTLELDGYLANLRSELARAPAGRIPEGGCLGGWTFRGGAPDDDHGWEMGCQQPAPSPAFEPGLSFSPVQRGPLTESLVRQPTSPFRDQLVRSLSAAERLQLATGQFGQAPYDQLVQRIVEQHIVSPTFADLNGQKQRLLDQPLQAGADELRAAVAAAGETLDRSTLDRRAIDAAVAQVQQDLRGFRFEVPPTRDWWRTSEGKVEVLGLQGEDLNRLADATTRPLAQVEDRLRTFNQELQWTLTQVEAQQQELTAQLTQLQASYRDLGDRLQKQNEWLPISALELRDAVRYFPLLLVGLTAYLLWRYRRWDCLRQAVARLQLAAAVPKAVVESELEADSPQMTVAALVAIAGLLWVGALIRLVMSPSLGGQVPFPLYGGALVLSLAWLATWTIRRGGQIAKVRSSVPATPESPVQRT